MTDSKNSAHDQAAKHRVFFALWPAADLAASLHRRAEALAAHCGGRPMTEDTLHLTLAFLGSITRPQLAAAMAIADDVRQERFTLSVDRLDYWNHNQILWAGCPPEPRLMSLAETLQSRLRQAGFTLPPQAFAPHITLLRHCPQRGDKLLPQPLEKSMAWAVEEFLLVESRPQEGRAHYTPLARWSLTD